MGDRLLHIDIFAGLHGPDGGEDVPVIAGGNHDGVNALVVHDLAQILRGLCIWEGFFGLVQGCGVRITEVSDFNPWDLGHAASVSQALPAETDGSNADGVIGPKHPAG